MNSNTDQFTAEHDLSEIKKTGYKNQTAQITHFFIFNRFAPVFYLITFPFNRIADWLIENQIKQQISSFFLFFRALSTLFFQT